MHNKVYQMLEALLTTAEVATYLGSAEITIRKWRTYGGGPAFVRCGGNIRYRRSDVEAWTTARTVANTSQAA